MKNPVLAALQRPSPGIERLAASVVREFDSVIVRGSSAEAYVRKSGYRGSLAVITGSAEPCGAWRDFSARTIDLAFVGRLEEDKRPERFVAVVASVANALPGVRAVVIGDGPYAASLRSLARERGIDCNVEFLGQRSDVDELLAATRVFVLTSRSEGVSIAMLEAMAAGAVPVMSNVGDVADVLQHGSNGFVVAQDDIAGYAQAASRLLCDPELWRRCSRRARAGALSARSVDAIAKRWQSHLLAVLASQWSDLPPAPGVTAACADCPRPLSRPEQARRSRLHGASRTLNR
jgi:glycosyltransferase involved in cell wall biosynthesis